MTKQVQFRKGTTAEHFNFTGALAEITVDTDKNTAVVHDGSTPADLNSREQDGLLCLETILWQQTKSIQWIRRTVLLDSI